MSEFESQRERVAIEAIIRETIQRNQDVLASAPQEGTNEEYWGALKEQGQSRILRVRNPDGNEDVHGAMYLLEEQGGSVEITYFQDDKIGESFWIEIDRIVEIQ